MGIKVKNFKGGKLDTKNLDFPVNSKNPTMKAEKKLQLIAHFITMKRGAKRPGFRFLINLVRIFKKK